MWRLNNGDYCARGVKIASPARTMRLTCRNMACRRAHLRAVRQKWRFAAMRARLTVEMPANTAYGRGPPADAGGACF